MPEGFSAALALPGLWGLLGAVMVAGLVFGFAGFGAALVFLPVAVALVPLVKTLEIMILLEMVVSVLLIPSVKLQLLEKELTEVIG